MKKKLCLIFLCSITLLTLCGCDNKEYYCENEEHELVGNKCVKKVKKDMKKRYYCKNGKTPYGSITKWCDTYTLAEEEYYCETGYQEGIECVVDEITYDALVK